MKDYIQFWPQITILMIIAFAISKKFFFGGQTRSLTLNPIDAIVKYSFEIFVVICGGFFNTIKAPQVIYIISALLVVSVLLVIAYVIKDIPEKKRTVDHKISSIHWTDFVSIVIFYWGGFFDGLIESLMK